MRTVLYIEDDPNAGRKMMAAVAKAKPRFELRIQGTYYDAIDYLSHQDPFQDSERFSKPSLLLLDYGLGTFTGADLLKWIRSKPEFQKLPVVIFSGRTEDHVVMKCYALGADYFIAKPARFIQLVQLVKCINGCLRTTRPQVQRLARFALHPDLSRHKLRRELREHRTNLKAAVEQQKDLRMGIDLLLAEAKELRRKYPFKRRDRQK